MKQRLEGRFTKAAKLLFNTLTPDEFLIYHVILSHRNNKTREAKPSQSRIAKLVKVSKTKVVATVESLKKKGYLTVNKYKVAKGFGYIYTFPKFSSMSQFEKIPQCVLYTEELNSTEKSLYLALFFISFDDYSFKATQKELAVFAHLTLSQVKKALKVLKTNEWIMPFHSASKKGGKYFKLNSELWLVESNRIIMEQNQLLASRDIKIAELKAELKATRQKNIVLLRRL